MMHARHHFWGCGPSGETRWEGAWQWEAAGAFGVRRPLRFLAMRLGLDESQARELARILDEVKTERAQFCFKQSIETVTRAWGINRFVSYGHLAVV